ncbi:hypothetical protein GCM10011600_30270 [Pseudolysinimonas yzui]|uniref:Uncharacterized protein n=1 Tax=Pseudolysinimonas yzui TaxID=2708254 RepID=A0A8J3GTP3_9MICO|nr:hypothetical protein GCM10011600_30270 [Pseudolysinimonas yzui]
MHDQFGARPVCVVPDDAACAGVLAGRTVVTWRGPCSLHHGIRIPHINAAVTWLKNCPGRRRVA